MNDLLLSTFGMVIRAFLPVHHCGSLRPTLTLDLAVAAFMNLAIDIPPRPDDIVRVRSRRYLVEGVTPLPEPGDQTLVRLFDQEPLLQEASRSAGHASPHGQGASWKASSEC